MSELPDSIINSGIVSWVSGNLFLSLGGSVLNRIVGMANGEKITSSGMFCMAVDLAFGGTCALAFTVYTTFFVLSTSQLASTMMYPLGTDEEETKQVS